MLFIEMFMSPLSEEILKAVEDLHDIDRQQVLNFADFLRLKKANSIALPMNSERSFFEVAGDLIGAGEGPGDLSTNADYLKGYGE
jgi:hypothetical protein